eukprot:GHVN01052598.1.p1 GENE.GHVN01052598.1~~GHVN01052598.1.p1  ORF type:complete len:479 (+),score=40.80 GHVN01052598.1:41-1438(+)
MTSFNVHQWLSKNGQHQNSAHRKRFKSGNDENSKYCDEESAFGILSRSELGCWRQESTHNAKGRCFQGEIQGLRLCKTKDEDVVGCSLAHPNTPVLHDDPAKSNVGLEPIITALKIAKINVDEVKPDVVTFRNNLNKIGNSPLCDRRDSGWIIRGCVLSHVGGSNETVYLDVMKNAIDSDYPDKDKFVDWGYRFENICTEQTTAQKCDHPTKSDESRNTLDSTEKFCSVSLVSLGNLTHDPSGAENSLQVVIGAEIDCRLPDEQLLEVEGHPTLDHLQQMRSSFVELKTQRVPPNECGNPQWWVLPNRQRKRRGGGLHPDERAARNFRRFKLAKIWLQSHLGGVPNVVVGWRDDLGTIVHLEKLKTSELPLHCTDEWNPNMTLRFICTVLRWFKNCLVDLATTTDNKEGGAELVFRFVPATGLITTEKIGSQPDHQDTWPGHFRQRIRDTFNRQVGQTINGCESK